MAFSKRQSLKKTDKGLSHYIDLKNDYYNDPERLGKSLPLFVRIMLFDRNTPFIHEINRFDFFLFMVVSSEIKRSIYLDTYVETVPRIGSSNEETNDERIYLDESEFFSFPIIKISGNSYSIKDFVFAVGYNGNLHKDPSGQNEEKHRHIYEHLILAHEDFAQSFVEEISYILIELFDPIYKAFNGSNDAVSPFNAFQPKIISNGKLLEGNYFNKSIMQVPIRKKREQGIRICISLKLIEEYSQENVIFTFGHRSNNDLSISLSEFQHYLIAKIFNKNGKFTLRGQIPDKFYEDFGLVEVAVYPRGQILLAINGYAKDQSNTQNKMYTIDGSVKVGCDRNAQKFGEFFLNMFALQSIDKFSNFRELGKYFTQSPLSPGLKPEVLSREI